MSQTADTETIYRTMLKALNSGDADAAAAHFAEDTVYVNYAEPTVEHVGREAAAAVIRSTYEAFAGLNIEIVSVTANEDRLAAEMVLRGVPDGQSGPVEVPFCAFDVFRGAEIVSEHAYFDSAQLAGAS